MKAAYALGFLDSLLVAYEFLGSFDGTPQPSSTSALEAKVRFSDNISRFTKHVSADQLSDGITSFYSDVRNGNVTPARAAYVVLLQIGDAPDVVMKAAIDAARAQ